MLILVDAVGERPRAGPSGANTSVASTR
jgi:hypothetical protein